MPSVAFVFQPVLLIVLTTSPVVANLASAPAVVSAFPSLPTTALPVVEFAEALPLVLATTLLATEALSTEKFNLVVLPSVVGLITTEPSSLVKLTVSA